MLFYMISIQFLWDRNPHILNIYFHPPCEEYKKEDKNSTDAYFTGNLHDANVYVSIIVHVWLHLYQGYTHTFR